MKKLILSLGLITSPIAHAEVSHGEIALMLDGKVARCNSFSETHGESTAYRLSDLELSLKDGIVTIFTTFHFLRCANVDGTPKWQAQNIYAPLTYFFFDGDKTHEITKYYSQTEIILVNRNNELLGITSLNNTPESQRIKISANLSDILNPSELQIVNSKGSVEFIVDLYLRFNSAYSSDGQEIVNLGRSTGGGFVVRGNISLDDSGEMSLKLLND